MHVYRVKECDEKKERSVHSTNTALQQYLDDILYTD